MICQPVMMSQFLRVAAALACVAFASSAHGDEYPARPITLIVPFAAGSGSDTAARVVAQNLQTRLGATVIVDNRVGATGMLAASFVARAAPDGYTLLLATNSTHGTNPSLYKHVTYDPIKDFAGIGKIAIFSYYLVINKDLPVQSIGDLVAYAKANPDKLSYGTGSSTSLVMTETFKHGTGATILKVPYRSNPPALTDVIAGRVSMMFADISSSVAFVTAGQVRALAVTSPRRSMISPDLPTISETVVPNFDMESWTALLAPAGTPAPVIAKLNAALNETLAMPEVTRRFLDLGIEAQPSTPAELDAFVRKEVLRWTALVKDAGIEPE